MQNIPRPPLTKPGGPAPWSYLPDTDRRLTLTQMRSRLIAAPPPRSAEFDVEGSRSAAVLVALYEAGGEPHVILTKRPETMPSHQGEIAFPGGKRDPGDASLVAAALREAHEEVGLEPHHVEVIAELDTIATVASAFTITPFVGLLAAPPVLVPEPWEVVAAFGAPVSDLLGPDAYREEMWHLWGDYRSMTFFELPGETVWGATARILTRLLTLVTNPVPNEGAGPEPAPNRPLG